MSRLRVAVLDYDAGNVRSAKRGFDAAGAEAFVANRPTEVHGADVIVIPGVGHFGTCLRQLRRSGLHEVIVGWIEEQRPVFGICVGMQLLYDGSAEDAEPGLGLLPGRVERFPSSAVVPHLGWDVVSSAEGHSGDPLLAGVDGERLYFVHSYFAVPRDTGHVVARCHYGDVDFPCLVREGSVVGTQFHPEKSGIVGQRLLSNWIATL